MDIKKRYAEFDISLFKGRLVRKQRATPGTLHLEKAFSSVTNIVASIIGVSNPAIAAGFVAAKEIAREFIKDVVNVDVTDESKARVDADVHELVDINFSSFDPRDSKSPVLEEITINNGEKDPYHASFRNYTLSTGTEMRVGVIFNLSCVVSTAQFSSQAVSFGKLLYLWKMPNDKHPESFRIDILNVSEGSNGENK